jgi:hypothetical protein
MWLIVLRYLYPEYIALNGSMINEWRTGKDLKESGCALSEIVTSGITITKFSMLGSILLWDVGIRTITNVYSC